MTRAHEGGLALLAAVEDVAVLGVAQGVDELAVRGTHDVAGSARSERAAGYEEGVGHGL